MRCLFWGVTLGLVLGVGGAFADPAQSKKTKQVAAKKKPKKPRYTRRKKTRPDSLWQTIRSFWGPKLRFILRANREFWGPQARYNRKFWRKRARFVLRANREFWAPKLKFMMKANRGFWGPLIEKQYLPYVRDQFRFLKFNYGDRISWVYARSMRLLRPVLKDFPAFLFYYTYKALPKDVRDSLENVPAPVKKAFDKYFSWSLQHMPKTSRIRNELPKHLRETMSNLSKAMVLSRNRRYIRRVSRVFSRVRRFAEDSNMLNCYRVIALQSPVVNAFNTGCTTYVTSALAGRLTDLELAAVLAHELAHGDQGHAVKNLWLLSQSVGEHLFRLMSEEIEWFLSGKVGPVLRKVLKQGNALPVLHAFGLKAPAVEVSADQGGTRILLRAGISPKHLITALMKLHGKQPNESLTKDLKSIKALRHYPSLYRRVQAVRKEWSKKSKKKRRARPVSRPAKRKHLKR